MAEQDTIRTSQECALCGGAEALTQQGVAKVYLLAHPICVALMVAGLVLAAVHSPWWLVLAGAGFLWPLMNADLRLLLYPYVALGTALGRTPVCPRCRPGSAIFRIKT